MAPGAAVRPRPWRVFGSARSSLLCVLVLALAGCASGHKPIVPDLKSGEPAVIVLQPLIQDDFITIDFDQVNSFGLLGAAVSPAAILVGSGLDYLGTLIRYNRVKRQREAIAAAIEGIDIESNLAQILGVLPAGVRIQPNRIGEPVGLSNRPKLVQEIRRESKPTPNIVMLVDAAYRISIDHDQLIVTLVQRTYAKGEGGNRRTRTMQRHLVSRRLTYLSPRHELVQRPFREGEQAELLEALAARYADLPEDPEVREAYEAARDAEWAELAEATVVPVEVAVAEIWTRARIDEYLEQAKAHLSNMLLAEWALKEENRYGYDAVNINIDIVRGRGRPQKTLLAPIGETETHRIARDRDRGDLYAVPLSEPVKPWQPVRKRTRDPGKPAPCVVSADCE